MASSRNSKSSGLRILWIPGRRHGRHNSANRSLSKGRYDATNKQLTMQQQHKKNQMWSLGGNKAQKDIIEASPDTTLLDGPTVSSLSGVGVAAVAVGGTKCAVDATVHAEAVTAASIEGASKSSEQGQGESSAGTTSPLTPTTPYSSASTEPLIELEESDSTVTIKAGISPLPSNSDEMPSKTAQSPPPPILVNATVAEIFEDPNRFVILSKNGDNADSISLTDIPSPPLNLSSGTSSTTASANSPTNSPHKQHNGVKKKSLHHRNHNNNHQGDVNSIESISEEDGGRTSGASGAIAKSRGIPSPDDLDWIDELQSTDRNFERRQHHEYHIQSPNQKMAPSTPRSKHKKKHKSSRSRELDQLDGVASKSNNSEQEIRGGDAEEKVVKCLYYTLMCCDCVIS